MQSIRYVYWLKSDSHFQKTLTAATHHFFLKRKQSGSANPERNYYGSSMFVMGKPPGVAKRPWMVASHTVAGDPGGNSSVL
jgi:hypothetical protein